MYAKFENGILIPAPKMLRLADCDHYNPKPEMLEAHGYMPVTELPMPEVAEGETTQYEHTYKVDDGCIVGFWEKRAISQAEETDTESAIHAELQGIYTWLTDNDWKVNKIVTGEWANTDERWLAYLAERATKRARRDELLASLTEVTE